MSPSRIVVAGTGGFVAAMLAHAWSPFAWLGAWGGALCVVAAFAVVAAWPHKSARVPLVALAFLLSGVWRYDAALVAQPVTVAPPAKAVAFTGRVAAEPRVSVKDAVLTMDRVFISGEDSGTPVGNGMLLSLSLPPDVRVGDTLAWKCKVYVPPHADAGDPWRCTVNVPPTLVASADPHTAIHLLLRLKNRVRVTVRRLLPEPDASFVLGLLIGDAAGIPRNIVDQFRSTGTSHVLAVSGYNVALVAQFAFVVLAGVGVRRKRAAVAVAVALALFAELSGGGAAVVRAAIMGGVGVVAARLGRRNAGMSAVLLAATAMLVLDPLIIVGDVGFRLSFAAVVGMRLLGKPLERALRWVPETFGLRTGMSETLAATLATLPVTLHDFGKLPVATVPVNMAIAPLVPIATATGGAALLMGLLGSTANATAIGMPFALLARIATGAMRLAAATGDRLAPAIPMQLSTAGALALTGAIIVLRFVLVKLQKPDSV